MLLRPDEIKEIEARFPHGISSGEVVAIFRRCGARFSAPTLRKYVQMGLLPQSRRVGIKGKHRGSSGIYPVKIVRQVNNIKRMLGEGRTLEEIRRSYICMRNQLQGLAAAFERVVSDLEASLTEVSVDEREARRLSKNLARAREDGEALMGRIDILASHLAKLIAGSGASTGQENQQQEAV